MRNNKAFTIILFFIFIMNYHFLPVLYPLTVEEEAGKKKIEGKKMFKEDERSTEEVEIFGRSVENRYNQQRAEKKDPRLACLLSLVIPGGGHIYLRKDLKGIGFCLAAVTGYSVTGYYIYRSFVQDIGPDFKSKAIVSGLLFFISAIVHVVGIIEAYTDAEEINKKSSYSLNLMRDPYTAKIVVEE